MHVRYKTEGSLSGFCARRRVCFVPFSGGSCSFEDCEGVGLMKLLLSSFGIISLCFTISVYKKCTFVIMTNEYLI